MNCFRNDPLFQIKIEIVDESDVKEIKKILSEFNLMIPQTKKQIIDMMKNLKKSTPNNNNNNNNTMPYEQLAKDGYCALHGLFGDKLNNSGQVFCEQAATIHQKIVDVLKTKNNFSDLGICSIDDVARIMSNLDNYQYCQGFYYCFFF